MVIVIVQIVQIRFSAFENSKRDRERIVRILGRFFDCTAALITRHTGKVLLGCVLVTLVMLIAASQLGMKTEFADMMPKDIPLIQEYLGIIENYSSDATFMITIESSAKDVRRSGSD